MKATRGVRYARAQKEEQYFPEEYFSGSDVSVYFGDMFMDEIIGMQFSLTEYVAPVYGYNSYVYDAVARGSRLVQGSFTVAFKEAGYMYRMLEHVAQLKENARPALNYYIQGESKPKWVGNINETLETLMRRSGASFEGEMADYETRIWGNQQDERMRPNENTHFYGSEAQSYLLDKGFDIYVNFGNIGQEVKRDSGKVKDNYKFHGTAKAIIGVQLTNVETVIDATGEPVAERYSFIAKDLR